MTEERKIEQSEEEWESLSYELAPLYKRWFATFLDVFLLVLFSLALYGLVSYVTNNVTAYVQTAERRAALREESFLYVDDSLITVAFEGEEQVVEKAQLSEHIDRFYLDFLKEDDLFSEYQERKSRETDGQGRNLFVQDGDVYIESTDFTPQVFIDFYVQEVEEHCIGLLASQAEYNQLTRTIVTTSIVELGLCFACGDFFAFLFFPLVLKRGRRTVGMYLFKISVVSSDALNPRGKALAGRMLLQFFVLFLLSLFTFFLPVLVSLTMMHLSKRKQSFLDYMTGTYVVDTRKQEIYLDYDEYERKKGMRREIVSQSHFGSKLS